MSDELVGAKFCIIGEPERPLGKALWAFMRANEPTGSEALGLAYVISLIGDEGITKLQEEDPSVIQEIFRRVLDLPGVAGLHDLMKDVQAVIAAEKPVTEARPGHNSGFTAPLR